MLLAQIKAMPIKVRKIDLQESELRKYQVLNEPEHKLSLFLKDVEEGTEINDKTVIKPDGWLLAPYEELLISIYT
jgi:hypothetical protein